MGWEGSAGTETEKRGWREMGDERERETRRETRGEDCASSEVVGICTLSSLSSLDSLNSLNSLIELGRVSRNEKQRDEVLWNYFPHLLVRTAKTKDCEMRLEIKAFVGRRVVELCSAPGGEI